MDTFGWCVILLVALLFGIPYSRYFLRVRAIPTWPIVAGVVTEAGARQGSPLGYAALLLHHCTVIYEYQVSGTTHKGWFALMAGNERIASSMANQIEHTEIQVRYNPKRPADSLPVDKELLGTKVFQKQSWLNPNVW